MAKFKLNSKIGKIKCPNCKFKSLRRYVNIETNEILPEPYGSCDRVYQCAYWEKPPWNFNSGTPMPKIKIEPPKPISFTEELIVKQSLKNKDNALYKFVSSKYGEIKANQVFQKYRVGSSLKYPGATTFWLTDTYKNTRGGLTIKYDSSGHRIKTSESHALWEHNGNRAYNFTMCFFGEHLLSQQNKKVNVVEAPKTALLAALIYPEYIWIGAGGLTMLTSARCECLRGKDVTLFPDTEPKDFPEQSKWLERWWEKQMIQIQKITTCKIFKGLYNQPEGTDLADIL